jgi:hypothetical protein
MTGHTSSGAAVLIGGNVDNEMEITTPDEGLMANMRSSINASP